MSENRNHIDFAEWQSYLRGELPAAELLAVDDHLGVCPSCRERGADLAADVRGVRQVRRELEGSVHLSYEQMERFVDGRASREERALVAGHAAHCSPCNDELGDLTAYARSRRSLWPAVWPAAWWVAAAAALAIASIVTLTWMRHAGTAHSPVNVAQDAGPRAVERPRQAPAAPSVSSKLGPNAGKREVQLGASPGAASPFHLLSPLGTRVPDTRPVLRWSAAPGAESYRVQVFDAEFRLAASSPALSTTEWRIADPLKPGKIYSWQVTAKQAGHSVTAPQPPAPQALFEVDRSASDQSASPRATKPAQ